MKSLRRSPGTPGGKPGVSGGTFTSPLTTAAREIRTLVIRRPERTALQVFEQMKAEIRSLLGRDRAQPEVVIVGGFLRDIAAGAYDHIRYPKCLTDPAQGRRLHFYDICVKARAQRVDALLGHTEEVGGRHHPPPHLYLTRCAIGRNLVASISCHSFVGKLEQCAGW